MLLWVQSSYHSSGFDCRCYLGPLPTDRCCGGWSGNHSHREPPPTTVYDPRFAVVWQLLELDPDADSDCYDADSDCYDDFEDDSDEYDYYCAIIKNLVL